MRYLGALGEGPLPLDRPNQVKVFGNYSFDMGLNLGVGFLATSGKPLTSLAANPVYDSPGEIPTTVRGAGFQTIDGFLTRTPAEYDTSIHADYRFKISDRQHIVVLADFFNLFNRQIPLDYDPNTETTFQVVNPDFGDRAVSICRSSRRRDRCVSASGTSSQYAKGEDLTPRSADRIRPRLGGGILGLRDPVCGIRIRSSVSGTRRSERGRGGAPAPSVLPLGPRNL